MSTPHVLIVVTSHARLGDTGKPTGVWLEELAVPWLHFTDAGARVTLASVRGGAVPVDAASQKPRGQNSPAVERFLADAPAQAAMGAAAAVADLSDAGFDALLFPGGHGTMWDLPAAPAVARLVEAFFNAGKVVGAVCHGPAGLLAARRPDGQPVISGLRVNAFTDAEEEAAGLTGVVPFLLESRLRSLGARFESGPLWQPYSVQARAANGAVLVTGQNPASSERVAQGVLQAVRAAGPAQGAGALSGPEAGVGQ